MVSFLRPSSWTRNSRKSDDVTLASLAEQGKFDKFLKRLNEMDNERFLEQSGLLSNNIFHHAKDNGDDNSNKMNKEENNKTTCSILHIALANRAPLCVVEPLLDRINECCCAVVAAGNDNSAAAVVPEEIQDSSGKTPLHVAVENGCDVNVIERLLTGETLIAPAYTKDKYGRYPLHWVCCLPHETKEKRSKQNKTNNKSGECNSNNNNAVVRCYYKGKREIRRETIYMLLNAYPVAVVVPDIYGMTPLDYARRIQLDPHTIHALVTVTKAHGDIKFLARKAHKFVTSAASDRQYSQVSPNSSETTERDSTDEDEDDNSAVFNNDKEKYDDVSSSSFPEGMLSYGELFWQEHNSCNEMEDDDDVSSLGSQENDDELDSSSTKIIDAVATYVRPYPAVQLQ